MGAVTEEMLDFCDVFARSWLGWVLAVVATTLGPSWLLPGQVGRGVVTLVCAMP